MPTHTPVLSVQRKDNKTIIQAEQKEVLKIGLELERGIPNTYKYECSCEII